MWPAVPTTRFLRGMGAKLTVGDCRQKERPMALVVRAFPVKSKEAAVQYAGEVERRAEEARHFYSENGVRSESWHFQQTAHGAIVIGVTDVRDVEVAAKRFAKADAGF